MATTRSVQRELDNLRKEMAGLKKDYSRLKSRASATADEGAERFGAIRDDFMSTIEAIRDKLTNGTGAAADEIAAHVDDLKTMVGDYSNRTEKTIAAHPLAAVAGALAIWAVWSLTSVPPRIVLYRRPLEFRAADHDDLADLVHDVILEQVANLLGVAPEDLEP